MLINCSARWGLKVGEGWISYSLSPINMWCLFFSSVVFISPYSAKGNPYARGLGDGWRKEGGRGGGEDKEILLDLFHIA